MPTKNWTYGVPAGHAPNIEQQVSDAIYAAHQYRNTLCQLELEKRDRHEQLLRRLAPEYVAACQAVEAEEQRLGEAREAIQRERVKQQTKTPKGVKHLTDTAAEAKANLKTLRADRKAAKQAAYDDPAVKAAMDRNQQQHKKACAVAKADSGLYWGTEAIVRQACASFSSGAPPRFARFQGEGQLAVQLQGGRDTSEATEPDTRLQLVVPDDLQERLLRDGRAPISANRVECLIRVGSEPKGAPIFARLTIAFHRPLPPGKIKWAYLEKRKMADDVRYKVRLTIDVPHSDRPAPPGFVAVHVGWHSESKGLRVASVLGSDGKYRYLRLRDEHLADYDKLDNIRSQRDNKFNAIRERLMAWQEGRNLPDWLTERVKHIAKWKSPARLASVVLQWRDERFAGDDIFPSLDAWRKNDKHWWQHECRLRKRVVRRRTDLYRNFARQLSRDYGVVFIAPIQAKQLTEHTPPEDLQRDPNARRAKQAAVSDLLRIVREAFPLRAVTVETRGISQTCANCGTTNVVRRRKVQCVGCCRMYDVDENALANMVARGGAALKSGALLELRKAEEDRAAKQKEKLTKMQEANRAARKRKREAVL